eukprot:8074447-Heterocapsa_arctica.AAC.1
MAMIRAATEDEEEERRENIKEQDQPGQRQWSAQHSQQEKPSSSREWSTPKRKAWAAKGFEGMLDSDEDAGKGQGHWTGRKYGKGKGGRRN